MNYNLEKPVIDLDALELYLKEAMEIAVTSNDGVMLRARNVAATLHVIQRLREVEAERDWAIGQSETAARHLNADLERWKEYEIEVEGIISAFTLWGGGDLANEMSPLADWLRGLLAARPDRGTNYRPLPRPTL